MNELLQSIALGLKRSSLASKLTAGLVAVAVVLAVGVSAVISNRPHLSMLLSGLSDAESASAMKALAEAGIPFEASQPPGPFVIYVDDDDRSAAMSAIYLGGAMIPLKKGIPADQDGMSSVFLSNGQRQQLMQKNLWGETEKVLESLSFVAAANVLTSTSGGSPFSSTPPKRSAAVQLTVRNGHPFTESHALTAVMMVSRALEIAPDDIVLTDQTGKLWNGAPKREDDEESIGDWLEYKERYEISLSEKANRALTEILGPNRARVEIDSQWNFDRSTTSEELVTEGILVSRTKNETETPLGQQPTSSPVGASSNIDFGVRDAAVTDATSAPVPVAPATVTSIEERTEYDPSVTRKETVRVAPTLERLSVALFLDASLDQAEQDKLAGAVKAAVGYDDGARKDNFQTVALAFNAGERALDEPASDAEPTAAADTSVVEDGEPSALMRMILRRGVEVAVAVVFLFLLLSSLRSSRKDASAAGGEDEEELDPELLAQAQVQELLTSDPERVGEILSQWARDARSPGTGAAR